MTRSDNIFKESSFLTKLTSINIIKKIISLVPVHLWAMCYEKIWSDESSVDDGGKSINNAEIIDLRTRDSWKTGYDGRVYIETYPGRTLTLMMKKKGFGTVQAGTVIVPHTGLTGHFNEITFQTPGNLLYNTLETTLGKTKKDCSHIVTTIQRKPYNMHIDRGEAGARVYLRDLQGKEVEPAQYIGQLIGITDWPKFLTSHWLKKIGAKKLSYKFSESATSPDGAAIFLNVPKGQYVLTVEKKVVFLHSLLLKC